MCRLAAFPPNFPRKEAIKILDDMLSYNTHGTGSVYIKDDAFIVNKYPFGLRRVLKENLTLLDHMPHSGWTIAHVRYATHGGNLDENTHPFIKDKYAVVHNGVWQEHDIVKAAMGKSTKFEGETDSEVAAQLIAQIGPKRFSKLIDFGGVYLALEKNGQLWAINTTGELMCVKLKNGTHILASELDYEKAIDLDEGWYKFDKKGRAIDYKLKKYKFEDTDISSGNDDIPREDDSDDEDLDDRIYEVIVNGDKKQEGRYDHRATLRKPYTRWSD